MRQAQPGDSVHVHYTGSLEDGSVFDSSEGNEPIQFTIGEGAVIPGFEQAVIGMEVGGEKRETIPAGEAYGDRRDELIFRVGREQMPADAEIEVGDMLQIGFADGSSAPVRVAELDDQSVTLDANHPLAGKTLVFDLQLVSID